MKRVKWNKDYKDEDLKALKSIKNKKIIAGILILLVYLISMYFITINAIKSIDLNTYIKIMGATLLFYILATVFSKIIFVILSRQLIENVQRKEDDEVEERFIFKSLDT